MKENTYMNSAKEGEVKQLLVRVEPETKQKFMLKCIENNTSMQKVVNDFIDKYIEEEN